MDEKFIIDTDPGVDDTAAIFWLLKKHPDAVLAMTTVFGNIEVEQATHNTRILLAELGRSDIPLFQGCATPLVREPVFAKHVHGSTGMGGFVSELEPESAVGTTPGAVAMLDVLASHGEGEVSILALGPLTNVALAYRLAPDTFRRVRRIIYMGGAVATWGNATPRASANMANDPDAASVVIDSGVPLVQIGLDVCRRFVVPDDGMESVNERGGRMGAILYQMINGTYAAYDRPKGRHPKDTSGVYFNDAPCVGFVMYPELFDVADLRVRMERHSPLTAGETVADVDGIWGETPNVRVCMSVDGDALAGAFVNDLLN